MNEEQQLLYNSQNGDKSAFEQIIRWYDKKLYSYIYYLIFDEHEAFDLTQDTFIKAYENLYRFNLNKNFSTWLFCIAKNTTYNYIKKRNRNTILKTEELDMMQIEDKKLTNPIDIYEKKLYDNKILKLIDSLPDKYKDLIYLKYINELTYKQISEKLNIPEKTIETRLYIARKKLNKAILKEGL